MSKSYIQLGEISKERKKTSIIREKTMFESVTVNIFIQWATKARKNKEDYSLSIKEANILKKIGRSDLIHKVYLWEYGSRYPQSLGQHIKHENITKCLNLFKKLNTEYKQPKPYTNPLDTWTRKLSKLTGISVVEAKEIANEKLEYKESCIEDLQSRQYNSYSVQRQKQINKMERANPLRPIKDEHHAQNILSASNRHKNSNYEYKLREGKEIREDSGDPNFDVKEYARNNMSYS